LRSKTGVISVLSGSMVLRSTTPTDEHLHVFVGAVKHFHVFVGAVKHFPPDALGYPGDIFRPAGLSRQTRDVSHEFFSLKPFE
jgi:hypothetical protein